MLVHDMMTKGMLRDIIWRDDLVANKLPSSFFIKEEQSLNAEQICTDIRLK